MALQRIALVNSSDGNVSFTEITAVAHALQIQVERDFKQFWGVSAQVIPLRDRDSIETMGVSPIFLVSSLGDPTAGGVHLDKKGKPFAKVVLSDDWSISASHELLEMLVDPLGQKLIQAPDIDPESDGHMVNYLIEVSDPCEIFSYKIGDVLVSDFVTPEYYNPNASPAHLLDFKGHLTKPYDIPRGCYISWLDPLDRHWHQKRPNGTFITAEVESRFLLTPREDRDQSFTEEENKERHSLTSILKSYR
jgi:hypothetical protein